jgi:hypothetical protein
MPVVSVVDITVANASSVTWDTGVSNSEKARWLAKCAFRDWYRQQLSGDPHWSHIRKHKYRLGPGDGGNFHPCSLREVFEQIWTAYTDPDTSLIEADAARRITAEFGLGDTTESESVKVVNATLTSLVESAAGFVAPLIGHTLQKRDRCTGTDNYHDRYCVDRYHLEYSNCPGRDAASTILMRPYGYNMAAVHCAKDDQGCCYFTCLDVPDDILPWKVDEGWPEFRVEGLKSATEQWLREVGIPKDNSVPLMRPEESSKDEDIAGW